MKEITFAALAAATLLSPLAATAQDRDDHRGGPQSHEQGRPGPDAHQDGPGGRGPDAPGGMQRGHSWARGQRFDSRYATNYQSIDNWQQYRGRRLYAPPRGYHWVRSGNDAVLVAITGGLIGAVLGGAFN
jgi:Ni/Co efflux regulator RcnB